MIESSKDSRFGGMVLENIIHLVKPVIFEDGFPLRLQPHLGKIPKLRFLDQKRGYDSQSASSP